MLQVGQVINFNYTQSVELLFAPPGKYKLECWGASGCDCYIQGETSTYKGGYGGYNCGELTITQNQRIYICVGGMGNSTKNVRKAVAGGYNGGGIGKHNASGKQDVGSGGGCTSITTTNRGELYNFENYKSEILLVAGGGGGANVWIDTSSTNYGKQCTNGGNGGGLNGSDGQQFGSHLNGKGGTQSSGGSGGMSGLFGRGNPNAPGISPSSAGGGGGYYGGGSSKDNSAGGGGSGYASSILKNVEYHSGYNYGNGRARITVIELYDFKENETREFRYTGTYQDILLNPGIYTFIAQGANGGGETVGNHTKPSQGGLGGKASGTYAILAPTTIYIYVGERGYYGQGSNSYGGPLGGWNGGGNGGQSNSGSGGGATDFRLISGAWNNLNSLYSRFVIAGGGGGSDDGGNSAGSLNGSNDGSGGSGGGLQSNGAYLNGILKEEYKATQYTGNALGKGQDASIKNDTGGGGGGLYGGFSNNSGGGGAGGSGYIKGYPGCNTDYLSYQKQESVIYKTGYFDISDKTMNHGYATITCLTLFNSYTTILNFWTQNLNLIDYELHSKETYFNINYSQSNIIDTINSYKKQITGFTINNNLQKTNASEPKESYSGHVTSTTGRQNAQIVKTLTPMFSGKLTFYSSNKTSGDPFGYITGDTSAYNDDGGGNNNFKITTNIEGGKTYYLRCGSYSDSSPSTYDWYVKVVYENSDSIIITIDFYYTRNSYNLTVNNGSSDKYTYLFEEIGNLYFNNIVSDPLKKFGYWYNDQYQDNLISCHLKNANFMMPASNMTVSVKFIDQDRVNTNIYKNIFEQFVFDLFDLQNKLVNDPYERISNVFQIDHGFELYDVIKINENGTYKKAIATEEDYDAVGIVSEIINKNEFIITTHGQIDYEFVSASDSTVLYLSDSEPGKLVTYEDITTEFYTPIGFINGDKIMINIMDSSVGNTLKKYQEQLFNQELTYLSQEDIIEVYNEVYNS